MFIYNLRYAVMRLLRLVTTVVSEVAGLAFAMAAGILGMGSLAAVLAFFLEGLPGLRVLLIWGLFAGAVAGFVVSVALVMACGTPYRYKTDAPGVELVDCGKCGRRVPNLYHCPECGGFRWEKACFSLVWGLSAMVTVAWAVHDLTIGVILMWPGKKS